MRGTAEERFWAKVLPEPNTGHWFWLASINGDGYGCFAPYNRRVIGAHQFAYALLVEPVPNGRELDHRCKVRSCVNPNHLEAVTHRVNTLRSPTGFGAHNRAKTQCPHGHPYDDANTYRAKNGGRHCRTCLSARDRARTARRHAGGLPMPNAAPLKY